MTVGNGSTDEREELRLAIVLNGGVSLAVWISGVVNELDALRFYDDGPAPPSDVTGRIYASLKHLLGLRVAIDVVAGTSAGGLNGALLAAGIATRKRVLPVRDTWLDSGQLSDLLRNPSESDPPSLLRGDEKLLTAVRDAVATYFEPPDGQGPQGAVQATLTCTDLFGVEEKPFHDSYGDTADRVERRLHQRFHSGGHEGAHLTSASVDALARAARSSASFPFAFEPSELRPDPRLKEAVFSYDHTVRPLQDDTSRWVMDGGVLDNSPIDVVLEDVRKWPARGDRPVRRSIVFVVPYAGHSALPTPSADEANLRRVLDTTINAPRDLPDLENLDRVQERLDRRDIRVREAENVLLRLPDEELDHLALLSGRSPASGTDDDRCRRVGRRVLERIREARANLPIAPEDASKAAALADARERLREAQRGVHAAIWASGDEPARLDAIAGHLNAARDAVLELDVRPSVTKALQVDGPPVTGARLKATDDALLVLAGVSREEEATDVGFQFMRLCADARHVGESGSAPASRQPAAKLYGLELGHFGGFVRRSWRANDWMWGRLDGAARLVDLVLDPAHLSVAPVPREQMARELRAWLHRLGLPTSAFRALLEAALAGDAADPDMQGEETLREGAAFGFTGDPLSYGYGLIHPGHANGTATFDQPSEELRTWRHAWRIVLQTAILRAELPLLSAEVAGDTGRGFRPNPSPAVTAQTRTDEMVDRFAAYCGDLKGHIHEIVVDEANSRQGARLLATATAVTGSVFGARTSGFPGIVGAAVRTTRGALRVARAAVNGMTGSAFQRTAFVIGVALAGLAIGLTTISDLTPPSGTGKGATSGGTSTVMGIAFAVAVPVLVVALAGAARPARRSHLDRLAGLVFAAGSGLTVVALALWLWGSPLEVASGAASSHTVWWVLIVLVALSTLIGWVATVSFNFSRVWPALVLVVAAAVAVGVFGGADWAVKHWGGSCSGGLGRRCSSSLASGAWGHTSTRLALAAAACFVVAGVAGAVQRRRAG